ncbi:MAG: TlpA family protein disulfide reductase [Methylophilaceae bacterium]
MVKLIALLALLVCTSILLLLIQAAPSDEHAQTAILEEPNFLLDGVDGKKYSLDEFVGKGKWVVVNVWATACPFCREELFDLASFHDRHHA